MITTILTKLRQHTRDYFNAVKKGETVQVFRYGKPVADVQPIGNNQPPTWKRPGPGLIIDGVSLSRAILEERNKQDR